MINPRIRTRRLSTHAPSLARASACVLLALSSACSDSQSKAPAAAEPATGAETSPAELPAEFTEPLPELAAADVAQATVAEVSEAVAEVLEAVAEPESPAAIPDLTDWHVTTGHLGQAELAWRPMGEHSKVPRNVEFSMEALLIQEGQLVPGAQLQVTGFMPAHGHGMVQLPQCSEIGDGRYQVDGMLLHMRGSWQVRFTVVALGTVDTFTYELEL
ncbi:MAG: hypothetical protein ACI9EF_003188 [Pseudohongiellaceae bacterium]|jgi:hypothetical protein